MKPYMNKAFQGYTVLYESEPGAIVILMVGVLDTDNFPPRIDKAQKAQDKVDSVKRYLAETGSSSSTGNK